MQHSISSKAYGKVMYHCAKYPHRAVNGVILGSFAKKDNRVIIQDSVPLFHNDLNLTVMLEVALSQVEIYAVSKGLSIVGYYVADGNNQQNSLSESSKCIGNKIFSNSELSCYSCILMINNKTIFSSHTTSALKVYTRSDQSSNWKELSKSLLLDGATDSIQKLLKGIENGIYDKLVDFDSHLDGIDSDWTNPAINSLIDEQNTN